MDRKTQNLLKKQNKEIKNTGEEQTLLLEDSKQLLQNILSTNLQDKTDIEPSIVLYFIVSEVINRLTQSDISTLEIMGNLSHGEKERLDMLNYINSCFGHLDIIDDFKRNFLIRELCEDGRSRREILEVIKQLAVMSAGTANPILEEKHGFFDRFRKRR